MSTKMAILSTARPSRGEAPICVAAIGMTVRVRISWSSCSEVSIVETTNAPGYGPPLHRRTASETFEILSGRFLFEVDGKRFLARRGDLVHIPSGASRAFVNVATVGGRQLIVVEPGFDAQAFYRELDAAIAPGSVSALRAFGRRWQVTFLGPPIAPGDIADPPDTSY